VSDADRYQDLLLDNQACMRACISSAALLVAISVLVLLFGHGAVSPFAGAVRAAPASPLFHSGVVQVTGFLSIVALGMLVAAPVFYEARTYAKARRSVALARSQLRARRTRYGIGAA